MDLAPQVMLLINCSSKLILVALYEKLKPKSWACVFICTQKGHTGSMHLYRLDLAYKVARGQYSFIFFLGSVQLFLEVRIQSSSSTEDFAISFLKVFVQKESLLQVFRALILLRTLLLLKAKKK